MQAASEKTTHMKATARMELVLKLVVGAMLRAEGEMRK